MASNAQVMAIWLASGGSTRGPETDGELARWNALENLDAAIAWRVVGLFKQKNTAEAKAILDNHKVPNFHGQIA